MLIRIFVSKGEEVIVEWRRLRSEELIDLYASPSIVWMIKSGRMRWAGNVACMGRREMYTGLWWGT
jgi:hypothetical protein